MVGQSRDQAKQQGNTLVCGTVQRSEERAGKPGQLSGPSSLHAPELRIEHCRGAWLHCHQADVHSMQSRPPASAAPAGCAAAVAAAACPAPAAGAAGGLLNNAHQEAAGWLLPPAASLRGSCQLAPARGGSASAAASCRCAPGSAASKRAGGPLCLPPFLLAIAVGKPTQLPRLQGRKGVWGGQS